MKRPYLIAVILPVLVAGSNRSLSGDARDPDAEKFVGSWTLVSADAIHADGTRSGDYGASPKGLLMIDASGHYSLQIYKTERKKFASGDKLKATPAEYADAILGASTHFGTLEVDSASHVFTLHVEYSSYPNQEGISQKRSYELKDGVLTYRVATRPNGDTPVSVWKKL